ncbi:MAG: hypothetical protein Ta2G_12310 [Termitinemataceae bacterium]|nr:MAG: hypothetical protein Ta2G_12310 [Termitinemataceae bacterium]
MNSTDYGWALVNPDAEKNTANNPTRRDYAWNERNLLKRSSDRSYDVKYTYGADGERSGKFSRNSSNVSSETLYFNKLWSWYINGMMEDTSGRNSKNIYLDDSRIVTKLAKADGTVTSEERAKQFFYHSDHLGSAQLITDINGNEYERIEYTPFGELWVEKAENTTSMIDTPFRFTGKERDKETDLYYFGARYLDSRTSRWLSTDPALGEYIPSAPINDEARKRNGNLPGMGGIYNTVNAMLYHYAGNNPIKYVDPTGRTAEYEIDETNKTINIKVNITLYGDGATEDVAKAYKNRIDTVWGKDGNGNAWQMNINGTAYSVNFDVNVMVGDEPDKKTLDYNANTGTMNFIEAVAGLTTSIVNYGAYTGRWRSDSRFGDSMQSHNDAPHEYGHLIGFMNRDGIEWSLNIMGNMRGKPDQRNIDALGGYIAQQGAYTGIIRIKNGHL